MNWQTFKALYDLYVNGKIRNKQSLAESPVFKYHILQSKELVITKKEIIISEKGTFQNTFKNRYLQTFQDCSDILNEIGENTPYCRFDVEDILTLKEMKFLMNNGELEDIRKQIMESNETRRGVSLMFFKNEKHLDSSEALVRAVKTILQIDSFADDRDFQYLYILQCHNPRVIVLCENLYFLKMPEKARNNNIELWYAGGRNIEKLSYTQNRNLPIYYICDWDHDGLDIYSAVKEKIPGIQLLTPNGNFSDIIKTEHKSLWRHPDDPTLLSNLDAEMFTDEQQLLIQVLIQENSWIVEESNDLIKMVNKIYLHCN